MKNITKSLTKLLIIVTICTGSLFLLGSVEFTITVNKHKASFIKDVGNFLDGAVGITKNTLNLIK